MTIVESEPLALGMNPISRMALLPMLQELGVGVAPLSIRGLGAEGLIGTDADGKDRTVRADHVVIALGSAPRRELAARIEGNVDELFVVGDCAGARGITRAIREGFAAGWRI